MIHCYLSGDPVHDLVLRAFYDGCPEQKELRSVRNYEPSDVAVVFGTWKQAIEFSKYRGWIIKEQTEQKKPVVIIDSGYIKRGMGEHDYYACGLGGLNGRADFRNHHSPADRFEALKVEIRPWREAGDVILLCGQVPWDASVDFTDHQAWLEDAVERIKANTERPIVFRPHPKAKIATPKGCTIRSKDGLGEDLARAWAVVTFNSNAGVDAALAGIPVFVDDIGSMAYAVANRNLIHLDDPQMPDRSKWAANLAYCQWTPKEMREGRTWKHLFAS